jgi:broad specificity phosphatase PhoE
MHAGRAAHLDVAYPNGETWRGAVTRVGGFFDDLPSRWDGKRVVVIGHMATRYACEHYLRGVPIEDALVAPFEWQPGWEYDLP